MAMKIYMLDTCICSFIQREQPVQVLQRLQQARAKRQRIVISAITHAEMRFGATSKKTLPKHLVLVDAFILRLDAVLPWDQAAIDEAPIIRRTLSDLGIPIGANDTAIAAHALAMNAVLVTNNLHEFERVPNLALEDWTQD
jgi:tRNA(fMet)-specific endonuclease VapC